ncbi:hypothetical protein [Qipengyuania sp.]|uniref:hypothetical protein n=1 Tax=Qipengyuania sp. TaxID=2004515 RepID=UPI003BAD410A
MRFAALLAAGLATAAVAQGPDPHEVQLTPGVTFTGDGGVERLEGVDGTVIATFWRPMQYETAAGPVAGRMDCRATAGWSPFSAALFALDGVHAAQEDRLSSRGLTEIERHEQDGEQVRQLDVTMRGTGPLRYHVLTYIAVRTGDDIVSIRRTCVFPRRSGVSKADYRRLARLHTDFTVVLPPPASPLAQDAPSLETLSEVPL